jgi:D-beta-D-heptose 7-phosphate kinase/D-beta-D-heptose 1-phosphate adenosyltransferase
LIDYHPGVDQLARLLEAAAASRVLVVGDLMLDEYVLGVVERTSPEAPVPVLRVTGRSSSLGGAANVARQLRRFGVAVDLAGVVGVDAAGDELLAHCVDDGIDTRHVARDRQRITTCKRRAVSGRLQVLRIDHEDTTPLDDAATDRLLASLADAEPPDAVVVSDYAKGVVGPRLFPGLVELARRWGAPLLVDPKSRDFSLYRGATLLKPNQLEVEAALGRPLGPEPETELVGPLRDLLAQADIDRAVVTLGGRGMVVLSDGGHTLVHQPVEEVFDVSGAGDTAMSVLALGTVAGEALEDATRLANLAAGIVVRKPGVALCEPADLLMRLAPTSDTGDAELHDERVLADLEAWRADGRRIVFTNGCFDVLHPGHLRLLRAAAEHGDVLVVGLNSDSSVRAIKGESRPRQGAAVRAALLRSLSCVDEVVTFDSATPEELIERIRPDVLVKGADYAPHDIVGHDVVVEGGGQVVTVPLLDGWSTTAALDRLAVDGAPQ